MFELKVDLTISACHMMSVVRMPPSRVHSQPDTTGGCTRFPTEQFSGGDEMPPQFRLVMDHDLVLLQFLTSTISSPVCGETRHAHAWSSDQAHDVTSSYICSRSSSRLLHPLLIFSMFSLRARVFLTRIVVGFMLVADYRCIYVYYPATILLLAHIEPIPIVRL